MNKRNKNLFRNIIFYVLVILIAGYLVFDSISPDNTVKFFGFKSFVVISPSMKPTINVNDAVMVRKIDDSKIVPGDIITFKAYLPDLGDYSYVTHYVGEKIKVGDEYIFYTHGEGTEEGEYDDWINPEGEDVDITSSDVIGVVAFKIPYAGHLLRIVQDPILLALILVNIGVVVYIIHYVKSNKKIQKDSDK
ncbi:MAG: signal peptidase I [Candidatus Izemoplasmatales bacterium]|jgi:signal peptidase